MIEWAADNVNEFQSSPPLARGRYSKTASKSAYSWSSFNPRPLSREGATYMICNAIGVLFQSSPPLARGRYDACGVLQRHLLVKFQSSPPLARGRYHRVRKSSSSATVSILAPSRERALRSVVHITPHLCRFNPRPLSREGATLR